MGPPSSMPTRPLRTNPARLLAVTAAPGPPPPRRTRETRGPARPPRQLCFAPTPAQRPPTRGPPPITPQSVKATHASVPLPSSSSYPHSAHQNNKPPPTPGTDELTPLPARRRDDFPRCVVLCSLSGVGGAAEFLRPGLLDAFAVAIDFKSPLSLVRYWSSGG